MVRRHAAGTGNVDMVVINTAPTWRSIHSNGIVLRAIGGAIQLIRDSFRIVKALSASKFDAIHLTTSGQLAALRDLAVSYLAAWFGVGLVYHIRFGRIPALARGSSLEWKLIRKVMRRAAKVILIDQATFDAVRQVEPGARVALIPNCVDLAELPNISISGGVDKTALFLGWVIPTKGIGELVEAWVRLNPLGWRLDIIGPFDESYRSELVERFAPRNLRFLGQLPHKEAMQCMAHCDLFVLPSYTEGFPNVVVEAMALGRPIIATDVGAIPEMLEDDAGLLVKSRDTGALAEALDRVMHDEELRHRIAGQARARANALYTIDVVFEAYQRVWHSVSSEDEIRQVEQ